MRSLLLLALILGAGFYFYSAYFLATIVVLGFLIFFHELGHFLAAKALKIQVEAFSIGFGEVLLSRSWGGTNYRLSALPLGGYVKLRGQNDLAPAQGGEDQVGGRAAGEASPVSGEDQVGGRAPGEGGVSPVGGRAAGEGGVSPVGSYSTLPPAKKILILAAGPFFNLLLAFLLYFIIGQLGEERLAARVGAIQPGSAAALAGLKVGDEILAIDGVGVRSFDEISPLLKNTPSLITLRRGDETGAGSSAGETGAGAAARVAGGEASGGEGGGEVLSLLITPRPGLGLDDFGRRVSRPMLGISPSGDRVEVFYRGWAGVSYAWDESVEAASLIVRGVAKLITGQIPAENLGGIITMSELTSRAAEASLSLLLIITALLSVNLGILNLLPVPMLDGGHILFNLYELIFRRPLPTAALKYLSYAGLALLVCLMVFATFNDLVRAVGE